MFKKKKALKENQEILPNILGVLYYIIVAVDCPEKPAVILEGQGMYPIAGLDLAHKYPSVLVQLHCQACWQAGRGACSCPDFTDAASHSVTQIVGTGVSQHCFQCAYIG